MLALRDGEILQLRHSAQVRKAHLIAVCVAADIARRKHIGNGQRRVLGDELRKAPSGERDLSAVLRVIRCNLDWRVKGRITCDA